jgi:hypothetical protein
MHSINYLFYKNITGNDRDNFFRCDSRNEHIRGRGKNDILQGLGAKV